MVTHCYTFAFDLTQGILGDTDDPVTCVTYRPYDGEVCGVQLYNNTEPVTDTKDVTFTQLYKRQVENILALHTKDEV